MCDVFENKNLCYNLRSETHFYENKGQYLKPWDKLLKYLAIKVWDITSYVIKSIENLELFKIENKEMGT